MSSIESESLPNDAAAYVRMSTEHQQYSTSNQMDVIRDYAKRRELRIVTEYSDEGKSGLNIQGRDSLARMIRDVQSGNARFRCILVYDVSRWGRFQDADESAYYEYICRQAGVAVHYCAEQFENDGSPVSTIVKGVKRAMAGEYSRELSSKVFQGACRLIQLGYKQGGTAGYGLRRMLVDQNGMHKGILKLREQKSIQTDRVILVRGPEEEVARIKWIYEAFVQQGRLESDIAATLNAEGITTDFGRAWTRSTVQEVLTNEKYIGNNVYHRTSCKLKRKSVTNPPDQWIRANGVFEGIVEPNLFLKAQEIILSRNQKLTDEEMLDYLKSVLKQHGQISGILIDQTSGGPSSSAFQHRFGSLTAAYKLIGYDPGIDYSFIETNRHLRAQHRNVIESVFKQIEGMGVEVAWDDANQMLIVHREVRLSVVVCRHTETRAGASRWLIRLDAGLKPDLTIAVRMDAANEGIRDFYLLPAMDMTWENLKVAEENGVYLDAYRYETLDYFYSLTKEINLEKAA